MLSGHEQVVRVVSILLMSNWLSEIWVNSQYDSEMTLLTSESVAALPALTAQILPLASSFFMPTSSTAPTVIRFGRSTVSPDLDPFSASLKDKNPETPEIPRSSTYP
jgi:hypothetical protein